MKRAAEFYAYARERQAIYLRRQAGLPKPWTQDKIFWDHPFCNVFREQDKTTMWFAKHVREPLRDRPEVLLATVVFRMFNRISVGEALFNQLSLESDGGGLLSRKHKTAFDLFLQTSDTRHLRRAILANCGRGPYVTGAYIISSPPGYSKLDGVLRIIGGANAHTMTLDLGESEGEHGWRTLAKACMEERHNGNSLTMEKFWTWLKQFPYLGKFHSYEIATDLTHTYILEKASDRTTWANLGPGAKRGINRVMGRDKKYPVSTEQALEEMRELLKMSEYAELWPRWQSRGFVHGVARTLDKGLFSKKENWPAWEMRDVEHTLCEFDKYSRVKFRERTEKGTLRKPRGRFDGRA